ncbi:hypothetical protein Ancab_027496 [Ancistrocladus abbreviatus]
MGLINMLMDSVTSAENNNGMAFDFSPLIRVYKDGRVERLLGTATLPAGFDPQTGVHSKDVNVISSSSVKVRVYLPKYSKNNSPESEYQNPNHKLPLLIYFHGGGFCIESVSSPTFHNHLNLLASQANVVVVSVEYRRAPEFPLPIAYHDSWAAVHWVHSHASPSTAASSGSGARESWLHNSRIDYSRVFLAGDSSGANIAHHMAIRAGLEGLHYINLAGLVLLHPFFAEKDPISPNADAQHRLVEFADRFWKFVCPDTTTGLDDPLVNPAFDPNLKTMACDNVLIFVAEKDPLRVWGLRYKEILGKSGWRGVAQLMEARGEDHVFHLFNPSCDNAVALMDKLVLFINSTQQRE